MSKLDVSDLRFSSSSLDDFFAPAKQPAVRSASVGTRHRVASLHQLAGFSMVAEDTLVRVSQQDFWKLGQDGEGYFIERLVSDDEGPIREG
jgi:phage gpG-like protein